MTKDNKTLTPNHLPDFSATNKLQSHIEAIRDSEMASGYHKRLVKMINNFDESLDNEHEVGIRLVNFGETYLFHLHDIGYYNPSLIHFIGISQDDKPVELIQHISQISILLVKMKRKNPDEPKKSIGFIQEEE